MAMNGNDDKELRKFFGDEFAKASPSEGFEDRVMLRVEQARSRQVKPLIGTPLKIAAIFLAIALPVIFIVLNPKVQGQLFASDIDGKKLQDFISGSSIVPLLGIILTYIALDVLWRMRKKKIKN
jgi:pilus assembly protein TadC